MKGWGPKSSVCPSKPRESNFFAGISRDFAGISRKRPKSLRKKCLGSIFGPYLHHADENLMCHGGSATLRALPETPVQSK